jgi:hypothetical protein
LICAGQPIEAALDRVISHSRTLRCVVRTGSEALELGEQPIGVGEQPTHMRPHHCFDAGTVECRARASGLASGHHLVLARAAVEAARHPVCEGARHTVHREPTGAAGEQATQEVIVALVVAERQVSITGKLRLRAIPDRLIDDRRCWNGDPLVARAHPAAALARVARLARAWLLRFNKVVAVDVSSPSIDSLGQNVMNDGR